MIPGETFRARCPNEIISCYNRFENALLANYGCENILLWSWTTINVVNPQGCDCENKKQETSKQTSNRGLL